MPTGRQDGLGERLCARAGCGRRFRPLQRTQRFHSPTCRMADWFAKHPRVSLPEVKARTK